MSNEMSFTNRIDLQMRLDILAKKSKEDAIKLIYEWAKVGQMNLVVFRAILKEYGVE